MPQNLLDIRFVLRDFQLLPHLQDIALGEHNLTICNVAILTGNAFPLLNPCRRIDAHLFIHINTCSDQSANLQLARIDHAHRQILQLTVAIHLTRGRHAIAVDNILKWNLTLELAQPRDIAPGTIQHTHADRSGDPHFSVLRNHGLQQNMTFLGNDFFHIAFTIRNRKIIIDCYL